MVVKSQPEVIGKQGDLDVDELIKQQKNLIDRQSEGEEDNEEGMDVDLDIDE